MGVIFTLVMVYVFFVLTRAFIAMPIAAITGNPSFANAIGALATILWFAWIIIQLYIKEWFGV